jgi:hypothetical protein
MTEVMSGLVSDAKKNKFSTIGHTLSEEGEWCQLFCMTFDCAHVCMYVCVRGVQNVHSLFDHVAVDSVVTHT